MNPPRTAGLSENDVARVAHEANRALQAVLGEDEAISPPWEEAPRWQTEYTVAGIAQVLAGLDAEGLHEAWCEHKRAEGWVYGPEKNGEAKTHPCLVDYEQLPPEQRLKDYLYRAVVRALADVS